LSNQYRKTCVCHRPLTLTLSQARKSSNCQAEREFSLPGTEREREGERELPLRHRERTLTLRHAISNTRTRRKETPLPQPTTEARRPRPPITPFAAPPPPSFVLPSLTFFLHPDVFDILTAPRSSAAPTAPLDGTEQSHMVHIPLKPYINPPPPPRPDHLLAGRRKYCVS